MLGCVLGALLVPQVAQAAPPTSVFTDSASPVPCNVQTNGVDFCSNSPALDRARLRRRPDRRQRRAPRRGRLRSRPLSADDDVPRLRRRQDRPRLDAALARPWLRHLLDDRPRLPRVVRLGRPHRRGRRPAAGRRLRQRLRAPDRQPLRGPRRAGVRRPARRREPDRPAADRRDRRLLRRRHVDGARRAQEPQGAPGLQPRPLDEPGWQADADRGGVAEHPLDRPRLLAAAERQHARLRRRRSLQGPGRGREAVAGRRALLLRARRPRLLRAGRRRPDCGHHRLAHPVGARRALRRERPADRRRDHPTPLLVLHRSLDRPGADADVEWVHRRPLPGRRDDPLLQPHPDPVRRQPPGAVLRRFRSSAFAEQERRDGRAVGRPGPLDGPLRQGRRRGPARGRHRVHRDLPERRPVRRAVHVEQLGDRGQGRDPHRRPGA